MESFKFAGRDQGQTTVHSRQVKPRMGRNIVRKDVESREKCRHTVMPLA